VADGPPEEAPLTTVQSPPLIPPCFQRLSAGLKSSGSPWIEFDIQGLAGSELPLQLRSSGTDSD
jgi:hypothetical protein